MAEAPQEQPPKKGRLKTILVMVGLLAGEAALILGALAMFSAPAPVNAQPGLEAVQVSEEEKIQELLVVDARLPNSKRGATYLYDTEVYVQIKRRHQDRVAGELEQFRNEIKAELTAIWRTSNPSQFEEPMLESLTRKVYALMNERFGTDPATEEAIIEKVVIVMGTGLRVDV
jgi:hypothetical protein